MKRCFHLFKKGTFTVNGKAIKLSSADGWDKAFNGELYCEHNGTNAFLTDKKDSFYLVKGSD